jgi:transcriptional regulator with XRE-family HTH domain
MTLQQIAQATGIATGRLSEYENGKHNITLDTFLRILAATDNTIQLVDACDGQFANPHVNARVFAELSSLADSA